MIKKFYFNFFALIQSYLLCAVLTDCDDEPMIETECISYIVMHYISKISCNPYFALGVL